MTTLEDVQATGVDLDMLDEYLEYLDFLRAMGTTNMFGARPYLMRAYRYLEEEQAEKVLTYWMATFSERHAEVQQT